MPRFPISKHGLAAACLALFALAPTAPAHAAGEILITHAKALAGNVTPGDTPGYPVTLSIPGSFQLASNLFVAAGKIGIQVTSQNVTVDLNGFLMQGSNVAWYGIAGGVSSVTIRNGTITGFKFDGIIGAAVINWSVEDMRIVQNGRTGVSLAGFYGTLKRSTVTLNGGRGLSCGHGCLVQDNIISENGAEGIVIQGGVVLGNVVVVNKGVGIVGASDPGYANNSVQFNNGNTLPQVSNVAALHPNVCEPGPCP